MSISRKSKVGSSEYMNPEDIRYLMIAGVYV